MDEACLLHFRSGWLILMATYPPHQALETLDLSVQLRRKYLKILYRTCGFHERLPTTMRIAVRYDRTADALFRGGCGDVWKGEYRDQEVAVKVIRVYSDSDLQKVIGVGCVSPSFRTPAINRIICRDSARRLSYGRPSGTRTLCP